MIVAIAIVFMLVAVMGCCVALYYEDKAHKLEKVIEGLRRIYGT